LRDRSAGLLSTATLLSGFASGLGLINTDPSEGNVFPGWLALAIVALVVAIGACALLVLIPSPGWVFTNNARVLRWRTSTAARTRTSTGSTGSSLWRCGPTRSRTSASWTSGSCSTGSASLLLLQTLALVSGLTLLS
jgi:hypothetical protein